MSWSLWCTIFTAIYSLVVIIHGVGLFLLYKAKKSLPNQRLLTINLAISEMLFCCAAIPYYAVLPAEGDIN